MTLSLYTLHSTPTDGEFIIQKFDTGYNNESVYALSLTTCTCPQGHKPKCRHRTMLGFFLQHKHIGDGWMLEWDTRMWRKPVKDLEIAHHITLPDDATGEDVANAFSNLLADETVMGTSAGLVVATDKSAWNDKNVKATIAGAQVLSASAGAVEMIQDASPLTVSPPPSPPEGPQPSQAAEAAPSSPVVGGVIVKRRRIP